jgi:hypothetical protein
MVVLVVSLAAACGAAISGTPVPALVAPTLAAVESLGFDCGDGIEDNVPSGLWQWKCAMILDVGHTSILVEGNDEGVASVTVVLDDSTDPAAARDVFNRVVDAVPPLNTAPILKDAIADWGGSQRLRDVGDVRVGSVCDEFQCLVWVVGAHDALRPIPLPLP